MLHIREMTIDDYEPVMTLMRQTPGVSIRDADSRDATERYLRRNPGFSFVAEAQGQLVGCVFCGHDGRRGYLQHLIVVPACRRRGIAQQLIAGCLERLAAVGIDKTHVDVLITNEPAIDYWRKRGWRKRDDICRFSFVHSGSENA
jgi:ribosomal protein S18 acetylase RimI-like enzyme